MPSRETFERFRAGDGAAFAEIVRAYDGLVRRAARAYWRSPFEREEAMQEVWLHVFKNRAAVDVDRVDAFPGWLSVVAKRKCLDIVRRRRPETGALEDDAPAEQDDPRDAAERGALLRAAAEFEERLKPSWRPFFRLCFVEGASYQEIEARLGYGALRCKYMKKVLAAKARKNRALLEALGRWRSVGEGGADAR